VTEEPEVIALLAFFALGLVAGFCAGLLYSSISKDDENNNPS